MHAGHGVEIVGGLGRSEEETHQSASAKAARHFKRRDNMKGARL